MSQPEAIRLEERPTDELVPPLDPALLQLSTEELEFLRATISSEESELNERILSIQKLAYDVYPYPCIRAFHFVSQMMARNPIYSRVINSSKTAAADEPKVLLDIGCHMGTDLRRIQYDGYAGVLLGCDLRDTYMDLGHDLFRTSPTTCRIHFFTSDLLAVPYPTPGAPITSLLSDTNGLAQLAGRVDHVYCGALFHLFDAPTQRAMARRAAALLRLRPGATVFGRHQGKPDGQEGPIDDHMKRVRYAHSPSSWTALWKSVIPEIAHSNGLGAISPDQVKVMAEVSEMPSNVDGIGKRWFMWWSVELD